MMIFVASEMYKQGYFKFSISVLERDAIFELTLHLLLGDDPLPFKSGPNICSPLSPDLWTFIDPDL